MKKTEKRLIAKVKTSDGSFGMPVNTGLGAVYEKLRSGDNEERVSQLPYTLLAFTGSSQEMLKVVAQCPAATEVLLSYFALAPRQAQYFMKTVDIQRELARHLRSEDVPNVKQLTVTLKRCGFGNGTMGRLRGWYATRLDN